MYEMMVSNVNVKHSMNPNNKENISVLWNQGRKN